MIGFWTIASIVSWENRRVQIRTSANFRMSQLSSIILPASVRKLCVNYICSLHSFFFPFLLNHLPIWLPLMFQPFRVPASLICTMVRLCPVFQLICIWIKDKLCKTQANWEAVQPPKKSRWLCLAFLVLRKGSCLNILQHPSAVTYKPKKDGRDSPKRARTGWKCSELEGKKETGSC